MRIRTAVTLTALVASAIIPLAGAPVSAASAGLHDDFNGDGYPDLAISAPLATIDGHTDAGEVAVLYGSSSGYGSARRTVISQSTTGITGVAESHDDFGDAIATGDLDGDGYADLVVGDPEERIGSTDDYGTITIVWGSPSGLSGSTLVTTLPPYHDQLGLSLATGDFDGDGHTDLAAVSNAGTGLDVFRGPFTRTGAAASVGEVDPGEVPESIIAGNVNGDAYTDLVGIGQSGDDAVTFSTYFAGSSTGLVKGSRLPGGYSAAIGDFNKDGYGDIAIGDRFEKSDWNPDGRLGGLVAITYGSATGPSTTRAVQWITQSTSGVPGTSEANDQFGTSVSAGDTNGDGYADLAVGVSGESLGSVTSAGALVLLRGASGGLSGTGAKAYSQSTTGVPGVSEKDDQWAWSVRLADGDSNGRAELALGSRTENAGAGSVWLFKTTTSGITVTGSTSFGLTTLGGSTGLSYFGSNIAG